jgi:hypothetical protein
MYSNFEMQTFKRESTGYKIAFGIVFIIDMFLILMICLL